MPTRWASCATISFQRASPGVVIGDPRSWLRRLLLHGEVERPRRQRYGENGQEGVALVAVQGQVHDRRHVKANVQPAVEGGQAPRARFHLAADAWVRRLRLLVAELLDLAPCLLL